MTYKTKIANNASSCNQDIFEVNGLNISNDVSEVIKDFPYWIQMYIPETLKIPSQKPDIETINSIDISVDIIKQQIIVTPISTTENLEGKTLSGRKLIVEGVLCQKIEYTAALSQQSVHSAHFYVPFSAYIVVPSEINFTKEDERIITMDSLNVNFKVNVCIEDVYVCTVDNRTILKQVTLLLYAIPSQGC